VQDSDVGSYTSSATIRKDGGNVKNDSNYCLDIIWRKATQYDSITTG
jgi:hypothetical protein